MLKVDIDDREVLAAVQRLLDTGRDLKPAMQDIGEYLVVSTRQRFQDGVSPDDTPWARNSYTKDTTRAAGRPPLIGETKQLSTKIFPRATAHGVEVGSPLEYAGTQQFGAKAKSFSGGKTPWGDIPARPFIGLSKDDEQQVLTILQEHLLR